MESNTNPLAIRFNLTKDLLLNDADYENIYWITWQGQGQGNVKNKKMDFICFGITEIQIYLYLVE